MTPMNRIYREGFDVDVAMAAAFRRAVPLTVPGSGETGAAELSAAGFEQYNDPEPARRRTRARLKALLRAPVKATYKLLRPFFRPLAFRTRSYLTLLVHQHLHNTHAASLQEIDRMSAHMLREVQSARELLRQDILALPQQPQIEQRRLLIGVLQEIQSTRDSLRRDLREQIHAGAQPLADAQRAMADMQRAMWDQMQAQRDALRPLSENVDSLHQISRTLTDQVSRQHAVLEELHRGMQTAVAAVDPDADSAQLLRQLREELMPRLDRIEQYGYATARRAVVNCAHDEVLVRTESGLVMCSNADYAVLACLVDSGELERGTRLLIERLLRPGEVFIDVGANLGLHTLAAARTLQGQGKIIAFEPFEATRRLMEKSVWINGFSSLVEVHGVAVSDREATLPLFLGASSGHHSLFDLEGNGSATVDVATKRLDAMIDPTLPLTLIKIDVEGAELQVLAGAGALLAAHPDLALIVEFGPAHLRRSGQSTADWLAAFAAHGFEHRAIEPISGTLSKLSHAELETAESTNLLFARPQSPAWQRAGGRP